ncbi:MAG: lysine--tRNA ligase [Spirochaetaceae bacterium]
MNTAKELHHWADVYAARVVRERSRDDGRPFTCASGITPSGTVHIGNFREIISVDLVVRALRDAGVPVRFIYSWDDYDVFRKVPKNVPKQQELAGYLRWPITLVPDPFDDDESYARHYEKELEALLPKLGIECNFLYQADRYRNSTYAEGIRRALEHRETIRDHLNRYRTQPLPEEWWPITIFSSFTNKDTTTVLSWDGEYGVTYRCEETGKEETVDLRSTAVAKLLWRIDWPMRWEYEKVDFEPAGKDHHSEGGSFDTAKHIVREVYDYEPPVTFQYDFIGVKGKGGKLSSSSGSVVSLGDVLEIYQPEVVRYLFAGTKPNSEFTISFDLDVIKIYEDYDRCERIYYGVEEVSEKRRAKEARIYELSQVAAGAAAADATPAGAPTQLPFRHLCNLLLIHAGRLDAAVDALYLSLGRSHGADPDSVAPEERQRALNRAACAWNWVRTYAPEDFRFTLKTGQEEPVELSQEELSAVRELRDDLIGRLDELEEKELGEAIYALARNRGIEPKKLFVTLYRVFVGKEKGPRLSGFLKTIGAERCREILHRY